MLRLSPPGSRVVFIHRDGRDVALSFRARGYKWGAAVGRWAADNAAAEAHLDSGAALAVAFKDLTTADTVLGTLERVAAFLGVAASREALALALLPGTRAHAYQEYCTAYGSDAERARDLHAALVSTLAAAGGARRGAGPGAGGGGAGGGGSAGEGGSRLERHNAFRTWQMAQAWAEVVEPEEREWTEEEEAYFWSRDDVARLMARFGYSKGAPARRRAGDD
jgi:hypothetical protein